MTWKRENLKAPGGGFAPQWVGIDSLYNPRHHQRWKFLVLGASLIVIHFALVSIFASFIYGYLSADDVDRLALKSLTFVFLPGLASLVYGGWFCRKYINSPWKLEALYGELIYSRPPHWLKTKIAEWNNDSIPFALTVGLFLSFDLYDKWPKWRAKLADVARVETSATADWEPARLGLLGDTIVPRDEVQAFLFMHNGSRRVIARVHAGREDMAKLTHSIRSWLDQQRQPERITNEKRAHVAALESADGFSL